ncbi:hypothetical protein [Comamonas sp.]|uniref:hypothetical protein n=1 Tax=Comamonas sp. TaxID=34028 RepID=UPI002896BCE8|nr:hypothetical protein [Comamonas sp.]
MKLLVLFEILGLRSSQAKDFVHENFSNAFKSIKSIKSIKFIGDRGVRSNLNSPASQI